jgi:hypothetical protein
MSGRSGVRLPVAMGVALAAMVALGAGLAGASTTGRVSAAADPGLLLQDSLAQASGVLPQPSDTAGSSLAFVGNKVRIVEKTPSSGLDVPLTFNATPQQLSRVGIGVQVTKNVASSGAGVYCRSGPSGKYIFWLSANKWGIFKDAGNAPRQELAGGTSKAIHTGSATNTIRAVCLGGADTTTEANPVQFGLVVNGKILGSVTDSVAPNPNGTTGLYVESAPGATGDASFAHLAIEDFPLPPGQSNGTRGGPIPACPNPIIKTTPHPHQRPTIQIIGCNWAAGY